MENEETKYKEGSGDDFTEFIFSSKLMFVNLKVKSFVFSFQKLCANRPELIPYFRIFKSKPNLLSYKGAGVINKKFLDMVSIPVTTRFKVRNSSPAGTTLVVRTFIVVPLMMSMQSLGTYTQMTYTSSESMA